MFFTFISNTQSMYSLINLWLTQTARLSKFSFSRNIWSTALPKRHSLTADFKITRRSSKKSAIF